MTRGQRIFLVVVAVIGLAWAFWRPEARIVLIVSLLIISRVIWDAIKARRAPK